MVACSNAPYTNGQLPCCRGAADGKSHDGLGSSPEYLMPSDGMSSVGGTRSGKHFAFRPELVVDGRTLGAALMMHRSTAPFCMTW